MLTGGATKAPPQLSLSTLPVVGHVDERFLSYNVEMVEITGGKFWRPYGSSGNDMKEYRPPVDLTNPRLRKLAAALGPVYIRFSGTWANATWFADSEETPAKPPAGFDTVLTRKQWRDAVDFAKASGGKIVTSFATSPGTRNGEGVWQTDSAARWLDYTRKIGGTIAAAEFANEPNMMWLTQPPAGYGAEAYRRDYAHFAQWLRTTSPKTLLLAPGAAELGEPVRTMSRGGGRKVYEAGELLTTADPKPDAFSFHYYGGSSARCGGKMFGYTLPKSVTPEWLDSVDVAIARMVKARDQVSPRLPLWNTESAETSCGGNPWASAFADSFRFVDTLGRSARQGVKVYIHNTLAASDYALLDEHSYAPRPNYWAALLWKRTMGTTVLASPVPTTPEFRVYAHCLPQGSGGIGLAAVNIGDAAQTISISGTAKVWTMQSPELTSKAVTINGVAPLMNDNGTFAGLAGKAIASSVTVPAKAIAFVSIASAHNAACKSTPNASH